MSDPENLQAHLVEEIVKDTFAIWQAGCETCIDYLTDLAASRAPPDLVAANARLLVANANIFASAAGLLLDRAGVRRPILNDA